MRGHARRGQGATLRPTGLPTAPLTDARHHPHLRAALAGCLAACLVTALWLSPALGRGVLLYRDFVQVPHPALSPAALGLDGRAPRAVPLDAVTAALHPIVSSGVQQQLMLLGSLALAGCGTAVLLRRHGVAAAVTGAVLATWNPYTAERLLLGQPPTLLGWAMIPWLVLAVRLPGSMRRRLLATILAAAPAALTPFGGLLAAVVVLLTWAVTRERSDAREGLALGALATTWCLPWIVVGLLGASDAGQRSGAPAFAVRHDGPLAVMDVLGGGGVWAPGAALASRIDGWAVLPSLVLLVAAVLVATLPTPRLTQQHGPHRAALRHRRLLLAVVLLPPVVVLALATPVGLAVWAPAQDVPGVGLLRDTHRLLGPATLAVAVLVGVGVGAVTRSVTSRAHAAMTGIALTVITCSLAVLSAPDAPARTRAAYHPVTFPAAWQHAVDAVGGRTVLVLPWQPFRAQSWAGPQPFLDPLPLALHGRALTSRALTVHRDGQTYVVGEDDDAPARAWARGDLDALRRAGIEAVITWEDTPGAAPAPSAADAPQIHGPLRVWILHD
ncbi:MAG: hypothetical protein Q4G43_13130 [Mobilicoccus sp.]|nr:hypothetical protein [Mobilicoccus sp.]